VTHEELDDRLLLGRVELQTSMGDIGEKPAQERVGIDARSEGIEIAT
jgi:hypothetical protein